MVNFEALEARANNAINARLANATATHEGNDYRVVFTDEYSTSQNIAGIVPVIYDITGVLSAVQTREALSVNGVNYRVKQPPEPDGSNGNRIELEKL